MLNIVNQEPLAPRTTFRIGGPAKHYVEVRSEDEVRDALGWAREHGEAFFVMGGGSNLLVPDEGFDGLVIRIASTDFAFRGSILEADAGCVLYDLIRDAADQGLGGWEKLAGIPGTLGGAVRGNAGAFGTEIKDVLVYAYAINAYTEETREFSRGECEFDYRMSRFKRDGEWIVLRAHIRLGETSASASRALIVETVRERERRHIQNVRAAGSYFLNPVAPAEIVALFEKEKNVASRGGRVPAGWLIEKAGLKGAAIGDAHSSEQHPNYLVNAGNASAREVRELADRIKREVGERFGIALAEEAVVLTPA